MRSLSLILALTAALLVATACSSGDDTATAEAGPESATAATDAAGIRLVDVGQAASLHQERSDDLVVLDVRTPEEFAAGHLDGAIMVDFYADDFADQLADLDPDGRYLLYCRSGNRSGQTRALMAELGFTDVADVDGGIVAWLDEGQPIIVP